VGHRHIRFPLEQLVEALQKYSPLRQLGEIEGHPKAETGPQIILKTQKDSPASETGESLTKTLSERKNGLVETGEASSLPATRYIGMDFLASDKTGIKLLV